MKIATLTIAAALACGAIDVQAATQPDSASAVQAGVGQVEPNAVDALNRMSGYLRSIPAFQITLQTQRDDVDDYGQLITLNGRATYRVRRPDSFSIDLALPNSTGQYVYDGKTVTVYDPKTGFYAKVAAAPTIRQTLDLAEVRGHGAPGRSLQMERRRRPGEGADLGAFHRQGPGRRPDRKPLRLPPARDRLADLDR
jgi:hypothetical protein